MQILVIRDHFSKIILLMDFFFKDCRWKGVELKFGYATFLVNLF